MSSSRADVAGRRGCLYSDHVRYVEQLRWFHRVFGKEQVLVLAYEEYRRDNEAVVREVLRFLDVDDTLPIQQVDTKPLKDVRVQRLHQLTGALQETRRNPAAANPALRALDALLPAPVRRTFGSQWRRFIYRPRAQPSDGVHARAAPAFQARSRSGQRVPRSGPGQPVGLRSHWLSRERSRR